MFIPGRDVFVHIPDGSEERVLHPGQVIDASRTTLIVRFNEPIAPEPGAAVFAHCESNRKFMQQAGNVTAILESDPSTPMIAFALTGEPLSAENRGVYRVSVAISGNVWATLNKSLEKCLVYDLSATGFGVESNSVLQHGAVVTTTIHHDRRSYTGEARVQAIRPRPKGVFRYGLHALESRDGKGKELAKGLGQISAAIQREQARRLAGSA